MRRREPPIRSRPSSWDGGGRRTRRRRDGPRWRRRGGLTLEQDAAKINVWLSRAPRREPKRAELGATLEQLVLDERARLIGDRLLAIAEFPRFLELVER